MTFKTLFGAAAGGLMLASVAAAPALAQEAQPAPAQPGTVQPQPAQPDAAAPAANFPEEKLRSFAVAFLEVDKVNKEYAPKVESAASEDEKTKLREEAGKKMVDAVNGTEGINAEEYGSIMNAAQSDPQLVARIQTMIGEEAQNGQ